MSIYPFPPANFPFRTATGVDDVAGDTVVAAVTVNGIVERLVFSPYREVEAVIESCEVDGTATEVVLIQDPASNQNPITIPVAYIAAGTRVLMIDSSVSQAGIYTIPAGGAGTWAFEAVNGGLPVWQRDFRPSPLIGFNEDGMGNTLLTTTPSDTFEWGMDAGRSGFTPDVVDDWTIGGGEVPKSVRAALNYLANLVRTAVRFIHTGSAPTVTIGANAGTGAGVISDPQTDSWGTIGFEAGSSPAAGTVLSVTFVESFLYPSIQLTPCDAGAAALQAFAVKQLSGSDTIGFQVRVVGTPTNGVQYRWDYNVIGDHS